jgi:putative acyl-CoA dehydrogenase
MEVLGGNGYVEEGVMARIYRQMPLNSIWEGSGNIMCLDILRAFAKHPRCLEVLVAEIEPALGHDTRFDGFISLLKNKMQKPGAGESQARSIAQGIALAVQGGLLVRFAPGYVADAFCASRLSADSPFGGGAFGALPGNTDFGALLARAWPAA